MNTLAKCSAGALMALAACRAPEAPRVGETPLSVPEQWEAGNAQAASLQGWWRSFEDPALAALIERALQQNLDLALSATRLEAARAQARIAGAALSPTVGARGDGGRQRQNFVGLPIPGTGNQVLSSNTSSFGVSLDVSWELDLWGKLDARSRAAEAAYQATAADHAGIQLSLAGQTAKTWFALTEARLQLDNATSTVQAYEQSTRILRGRFAERGLGALDLRLSESQLASAKALQAAYSEGLERLVRQLEILCGEYPAGSLEGSAQFPALPALAPSLLPSELLRRRPDLVAAEERLKQADLQLYAARGDLYPSLSLSASAGRRSAEAGDLTSSEFDIWSLVGNISAPIFQGGRLNALVDLEAAGVKSALNAWGRDLLNAFLEVESTLAAEAHLARREEELARASVHASAARSLAEDRYQLGRNDILAVLDARQRAFVNQSAQLSARRALFDLRVDLFLALGGGFGETQPAAAGQDESEKLNTTTSER
jgi:multidrug efflux system outer membrane protein